MKFIKKYKLPIFLFIVSFLTILIASESSPFYPINNWVDANCFFSVGKGMMNGVVPFKDVFEQKGPLLFLVYGLAYLISNSSFFGVFIFEILNFYMFLYFMSKIVTMLHNEKSNYVVMPILSVIIVTSKAFAHGGSAEEFTLGLLAYTLYTFVKYLKTDKITNLELFLNGLVAGAILMIKYTILGLSFGFMMLIFFDLVFKKEYKRSIISCFIFLAGMFLPFLIFIIYYLFNNGLREFIQVYFIDNLTLYSPVNIPFSKKFEQAYIGMLRSLLDNGILIFLLFIYYVKNMGKLGINKYYMYILLFVDIFFIYIGNRFYRYYLLPLLPFMIFPIIYIIKTYLKDNMINKNTLILGYLVLILLTFNLANYRHNMFQKKESLIEYQFGEIINESPGSVLNYQTLDTGVTTFTRNNPDFYYYHQVNIDEDVYPESHRSQDKYIRLKEAKYVVMSTRRDTYYIRQNYQTLFENYSLIAFGESLSDETLKNFYLFQVKE